MNCNFDRVKNLLGIYMVLVDSIYENNNINRSEIVYGLSRYLSDFDSATTNPDDFKTDVQAVLAKVYSDIEPTLRSMNSQTKSEKENLIREVNNDLMLHLNTIYNLPVGNITNEGLNPVQGNPLQVDDPAEKIIDNNYTRIDKKLLTDQQTEVESIADFENNYYSSAVLVIKNAKRDLTKHAIREIVLNVYNAPLKNKTTVLNKSVKNIKNKLFKDLVADLKDYEGVNLYDENGNVTIDLNAVLEHVRKDVFLKMRSGQGLEVSDIIRWSHNSKKTSNTKKLNRYNAYTMLKHFDLIINEFTGGLVSVHEHLSGLEHPTKYSLTSSNRMRKTWSDNDAPVEATKEVTKLYESIIGTLPTYSKEGKLRNKSFLEIAYVQHTMNKLDISSDAPTETIIKGIEGNLINYTSVTGIKGITEEDFRTLLALYLGVYRNPTSDQNLSSKSQVMKEILNSVEDDSLYKHFNRKHPVSNEMNLLDVVSANIVKIDKLSYLEVRKDFKNNSFKSLALHTSISNKQQTIFRDGAGAKPATITSNNWDTLKGSLNIDFITDSNDFTKNKVKLQFNKVAIYYDPLNGSVTNSEGKSYNDFAEYAKHNSNEFKVPERSDSDIFMENPSFDNYNDFLTKFETLLSRDLRSDNYNLLNILREQVDSDDNKYLHLNTLGTLVGNVVFTSWINANSLNGNIYNGQTTINKLRDLLSKKLSGSYQPKDVYDVSKNRYKIALGSSHGISAIRQFSDALSVYTGSNYKATTMNLEGNMVATVSLMSQIKRYSEIIKDVKNHNGKTPSPLSNNLLVRKGQSSLIKEIEIAQGADNGKGMIASTSEMNVKELNYNSILVDFLSNKIEHLKDKENDSIALRFQPTNFADKSRHSKLAINPNASLDIFDSQGLLKETKTWGEATAEDFKNTYYFHMNDYYSKVKNVLLEDYNTLLKRNHAHSMNYLAYEYLKGTKVLQLENKEGLSSEQLDILDNEVRIYEQLANLKKFNTLLEVDKAFSNLTIPQVKKAFETVGTTWLTTFHIEANANKMAGINRSVNSLVNSYDIKNHIDLVRKKQNEIERNFLESLIDEGFELEYIDQELKLNNLLIDATSAYKVDKKFNDEENGSLKLYTGDLDGSFEMNPILKDFLWQHNLVSRSFQLLTVGSPLGHKGSSKSKDRDINDIETMAARYVAQNKRMVIHQATIHPYQMNLINGVPFKMKKVYIDDVSSKVFSPTHTVSSIDSNDGSTINLQILTNLQNNSLLDQKVTTQHKSIAGDIDIRTGAAKLLKHAAFTATNDDIRNYGGGYKALTIKALKDARIGVLDEFTFDLDISRDYNNELISIPDLLGELSFIKNDESHNMLGRGEALVDIPEGSLIELLSLTRVDSNIYQVRYKIDKEQTITFDTTINNLYDLWTVLGAEHSVDYNPNDKSNFWKNELLDGYEYSGSSFLALEQYVNRVGIWYNSTDVNSKVRNILSVNPTDENVRKSPDGFKNAFNRYVIDPYETSYNVDTSDAPYNQKNIIQPLKLNIVGEFTFGSGQKVGSGNIMSFEDAIDPDKPFLTVVESYRGKGVQLNSDHTVTEDTDVSEQTQIISVLSFTGNTDEIASDVYDAIESYVDNNLATILDDAILPFTPESKDRFNTLIKKQVIKSFRDKDISGLANSIIQEIQQEKLLGLNELKIPVSSADMFGIINTAIANFFTKEGVRRKMSGVAAVAEPFVGLMKLRELPNGTIVNEQGYKKWKLENPDFQEVVDLIPNTIRPYDTIIDENGVRHYIDTPAKYLELKERYSGTDQTLWKKDLLAPIDLRGMRHEFVINGVGEFTYFDLPVGMIPYYSALYNQAIEDGNIEKARHYGKLYNSMLTMSNIDTNIIPAVNLEQPVAIEVLDTKDKNNHYQNAYQEVLNDISKTKIMTLPLTIVLNGNVGEKLLLNGQTISDSFNSFLATNPEATLVDWIINTNPKVAISELNTLPGEIAAAYPFMETFGISKNMSVSDVTLEYIKEKIDRASLSSIQSYDFYLKDNNGKHLYILVEGSEMYNDISQHLREVPIETQVKDGVRYKVSETGELVYQVPYEKLYETTIDGQLVNFITVKPNVNEFINLKSIYGSGLSKQYSGLMINYRSLTPKDVTNPDSSVLLTLARDLAIEKIIRGYDAKKLMNLSAIIEYANTGDHTTYLQSQIVTEDDINYEIQSLQERLKNSNYSSNTVSKIVESIVRLREALQNAKDDPESANMYLNHAITDNFIKSKISKLNSQGVESVIENILSGLEVAQLRRIEKINIKEANKKYTNFKATLHLTGARVPSQDNQSYSYLQIVEFINNKNNVVRVPPSFQWTTGGDFDIDKVFMMMYSIYKTGAIVNWSTLWKDDTDENLKLSLDLPIPKVKLNFKSFTTSTYDDFNTINIDNLYVVDNIMKDGVDGILKNFSNMNTSDFATIVDILNTAQKFTDGNLRLNGPVSNIDNLINFVNWYFQDSFNHQYGKTALLNGIFNGVKRSISDIRNVLSAYSPVTFGDYESLAETSNKGKVMKRLSHENPVDINRSQEASMLGKQGISIAASAGLKSLSLISNAMIEIKRGQPGPTIKSKLVPSEFDKNNNLLFKKLTYLKGINFTNNIKELERYANKVLDGFPNINPLDRQKTISNLKEELKIRGSVSLDMSSLLSAATDNAKELILGRLNANPDILGMYLAGSLLGIETEVLFKIMTSETTESIIKLYSKDVFNNKKVRLEDAYKEIKSGSLDARRYFNFSHASNIKVITKNVIFSDGVSLRNLILKELKVPDTTSSKEKDRIYSEFSIVPYEFIPMLAKVIDTNTDYKNEIYQLLQKAQIKPVTELDVSEFRDVRSGNQNGLEGDEFLNEIYNDEFLDSEFNEFSDLGVSEFSDLGLDGSDLLGESFFGGEPITIRPLSIALNRYMKDVKNYMSVKPDEKILQALETLLSFKDDVTILAQFASVNQGIKNTHRDIRNHVMKIVNYIRDNYEIDKSLDERSILEALMYDTVFLDGLVSGEKFLEKGKSNINLIAVLHKNPHIWSLTKIAIADYFAKDKMSLKSRIINDTFSSKLANENLDNYQKISNFADDVVISTVIDNVSKVKPELISYVVRAEDLVVSSEAAYSTDIKLDINSVEGRFKFINWFENTVITNLKQGVIRNMNGEKTAPIKDLMSNEFIKALTLDIKTDYIKQEPYYFYRVPIDLTKVNSNNESVMIDKYKLSLSYLKNYKYDGKSLLDLFYMYDLIVNKGRANSTSLKVLLDSATDSYSQNTFMSVFTRTLGLIDNDEYFRIPFSNSLVTDLYARRVGIVRNIVPNKKINGHDSVVVETYKDGIRESIPHTWNGNEYVPITITHSTKYINVSNNDSNSKNYVNNALMGIAKRRFSTLIKESEINVINC